MFFAQKNEAPASGPNNGQNAERRAGPFLQFMRSLRHNPATNIIFTILVPMVILLTLEWIARGTLAHNETNSGFFQAVGKNFSSFSLAYFFLLTIYLCISRLTLRHWPATILLGLLGYLPAMITYYKIEMRGEPFFPWDFSQAKDFFNIQSNLEFTIPSSIIITGLIFVVLIALSFFIKIPSTKKQGLEARNILISGISLTLSLLMVFSVYLNRSVTDFLKIKPDAWNQVRSYRNNGVITGFMLNLQQLKIAKPDGYTKENVENIYHSYLNNNSLQQGTGNLALTSASKTVQPDIIYIMGESFWDPSELEGIEFDRELTPNLNALAEKAAYGQVYSPRFGGGTCDVEFEALTGFSVDQLPYDAKPYQQYVTKDIFSLPQYLKEQGYSTTAIHGYGRKFWSRDKAYPRLGIDTFIASDDFVSPDVRRGFISDNAMIDRIIEEYDSRQNKGQPVFIHAVTIQNHSTYSRERFEQDQIVNILKAPEAISDKTLGALQDYATSINDMDKAIGKLVAHLEQSERPTIVVFWGDHMNPIGKGLEVYEKTGYISPGDDDRNSPILHETPLLIWSNYSDKKIDLGTIATYNISPVMMDIYQLDRPVFFDFLLAQMDVLNGYNAGVSITPDGRYETGLTPEQQEIYNKYKILEYDYMFGKHYLNSITNELDFGK